MVAICLSSFSKHVAKARMSPLGTTLTASSLSSATKVTLNLVSICGGSLPSHSTFEKLKWIFLREYDHMLDIWKEGVDFIGNE